MQFAGVNNFFLFKVIPKKKNSQYTLATGAGKSSLLNAVLDGSHYLRLIHGLISEFFVDNIVPTSGMRGRSMNILISNI